jgi:hypothetical protein
VNAIIAISAASRFSEALNGAGLVKRQLLMNWMALSDFFSGDAAN